MGNVAFLIPGDLETRTGGYEYDRRIVGGLRDRDWVVDVQLLDGSFPKPTAAALGHADAVLSRLPDGGLTVVDGLALGAMPEQIAAHADRLRIVALVHHPLALETGLAPSEVERLRDSERRALAAVRHVVVTSRRTVTALRDYDVTPRRVSVVEPGTDLAPRARGSGSPVVHLLCVASLSPRKGHPVLFRALGALRMSAWRLVCVGSTTRDPEYVAALRQILCAEGIADRVELVGEADANAIGLFYDRSDVFVLPTLYEGYGMVVAEALARGLPVISTPTGAIADLVTEDCGILVPPGEVDGWIGAMTRVLDPMERERFARGAQRHRALLRTWELAATQMAEALECHG